MSFFFPDNTALINFHILQRWDLLEKLVGGKCKWASSVSNECYESDRLEYPGLHAPAEALFGTPEFPTPAEMLDVRVLRAAMADPGDDHAKKHLGEAETIVLARQRFTGSRFITDDEGAARFAREDGVKCMGTGDLLTVSEKLGRISDGQHTAMIAILRSADRYPRYFFDH